MNPSVHTRLLVNTARRLACLPPVAVGVARKFKQARSPDSYAYLEMGRAGHPSSAIPSSLSRCSRCSALLAVGAVTASSLYPDIDSRSPNPKRRSAGLTLPLAHDSIGMSAPSTPLPLSLYQSSYQYRSCRFDTLAWFAQLAARAAPLNFSDADLDALSPSVYDLAGDASAPLCGYPEGYDGARDEACTPKH
ncbi:unnamed protein product [Peniophora sp. CBMAI 1063]|nr:unnamed protein product [Peniophora sp. CBMAI 1063]